MICRGTDKHRFECVYRGQHYLLGSLSDHVRHRVPQGVSILFDQHLTRSINVRTEEVAIPPHPIHWARSGGAS